MATEQARWPHDDDHLRPEQRMRVDRALADSAAGRAYENVTTEALEQFVALDDAEARRLLTNPEALRQWLAAHT